MQAATASPANLGAGKDVFPIQDGKATKKCRSVLYTPTQNCGISLHIGKENKNKQKLQKQHRKLGRAIFGFSISYPSSDV